jgi:hypothetical protein
MTIEQRMDQLEKRNKRLTVALTMMAVAMCAVVTMAATGLKDGVFDTVTARNIYVKNDAGKFVVLLSANDAGGGLVETYSVKGKKLVALGSTVNYDGAVTTYQPNGKELVSLIANDNGGFVDVFNKTGEDIVTLGADEYGNGVVGAWDRKGKGLTLEPGP